HTALTPDTTIVVEVDNLGDGDSHGGDGHASFRPTSEPSSIVFDEMMETGAVVVGRRTIEQAGFWGGEHHDGVPVFIPTHQVPDTDPPGRLRYVTDGIESCVAQAKAAAGDRDVLLHGANTAQECLRAGVLDVLEIQLIPVLLGRGRLLFDGLEAGGIELDLVRTLEGPEALHLRYEVRYQ
ncbi:MAG: dihydrofolate reductase, partial [Gemmatimonas sp.]|nr:dihydrofolate reductase [Gemmatimonas sp.]